MSMYFKNAICEEAYQQGVSLDESHLVWEHMHGWPLPLGIKQFRADVTKAIWQLKKEGVLKDD